MFRKIRDADLLDNLSSAVAEGEKATATPYHITRLGIPSRQSFYIDNLIFQCVFLIFFIDSLYPMFLIVVAA